MADRIIEGYWDCKYCGNVGIGGLTKTCPSCGHPQDGDVKFYMTKKKVYVTGEAEQKAKEGPDWVCAYCGSLNSNSSMNCRGCSAERKEAKSDYFGRKTTDSNFGHKSDEEHEISYYEREAVEGREEERKRREREKQQEYVFDNQYTKESQRNFFSGINIDWSGISKVVLFVLVAALIVGGLVMLFYPREYTAIVDASSWEKAVDIQDWRTVAESDWSVPTGGRVYNQQEEIYTYEKVLDHYETRTRHLSRQVLDHYDTDVHYTYSDNGNGTFTEHSYTTQTPVYRTEYYTENYEEPVYRDEPVYKTKYYYYIDKWVYNRTEKSSGENTLDDYWPEYTLKDNERVSDKREVYVLHFQTEKKSYSARVLREEWEKYVIGSEVQITVSAGFVTKIGNVEVQENN